MASSRVGRAMFASAASRVFAGKRAASAFGVDVVGTPMTMSVLSRAVAFTTSTSSASTSSASSASSVTSSSASSSSKPASLEITEADGTSTPNPTLPERSQTGWRRALLSIGGYFSDESRRVRGAERLYGEVSRAMDEDALYATHGLEKTFVAHHSMTCLHVWALLGRLRREGEDAKAFSQMFYDAFQDDVERRVYEEGVRVRVRKWLQDLEKTFYGNALSYDKALELGGGELAKALHRNVFDGEGDDRGAKALERHARRVLTSLALTPTEAIMDGRIRFKSVGGDKDVKS